MGDRANVYIRSRAMDPASARPERGVFLYTHWGGSNLPIDLQHALRRKERWQDGPYLTRIIFCEMMRDSSDDPLGGETGFGISTDICDNEHPILAVYPEEKSVALIAKGQAYAEPQTWKPLVGWSFEAFCKLDLTDGWNALLRKAKQTSL